MGGAQCDSRQTRRPHMTRKISRTIGIGRFRILGGQGLEHLEATRGGGDKSQQAHDVVTTSMRRNDVAPMSFRRHVPTRAQLA